MNCKNCGSSNCIKKGKRREKQRYYCKTCSCNFQSGYHYNAYHKNTDTLICSFLKEGCGIRSISRITRISKNTVLSRILKISKQIKPPMFSKSGCKFEVDELWSFVGHKKNVVWITYAIERETKKVIGFYVGGKSKLTIKPLVDTLLSLRPRRIYTDRLNIYPSLIPGRIHKVFQYCTNTIERMNLTLRTHIKRLARKTICFSRNKIYLEAHLRIYFWG
ncbi:IS1 family transposase [Ascidiimonas aurantiaca]|uniref:IS1 family transposase n=1 Tax=Ascidiimonas aurantiaca TaxID=1685432 RepID=UPI0030EE243B